ncbi:hypothetical protein P152DRAFT_454038 [Eremomyces bilateralis CBS 781.70]|uniref:DNase I-like protein n=1 Tax=Eremomyces bilateralis CBS 781.70 TaxID=1392243 RepID=A0A6G1GHV6_9PEZI|nr:uncharacterized protein P152DRAFT_454038 [Eremomyces bilateralis CBS 781.70]KAF1817450.1 hypothetical protein P152DRAFT_454038 [Eremomyces bilateralis CBS 781.70]
MHHLIYKQDADSIFSNFCLISSCCIYRLGVSFAGSRRRRLIRPSQYQISLQCCSKSFTPKKSGGKSASSTVFKALQLNLCNSGFAKCYSKGKAVGEGNSAISLTTPHVVTLNEICLQDIQNSLHPTFASSWPDDHTYYVFQPAIDKRTNGAYKCKNGDQYGIAVIGRVAASKWSGFKAYGGHYVAQDGGNEQRSFACAAASSDHFACTTHLNTTKATAMTQCKALMFEAAPYLKTSTGFSGSTVVGGDLNLKYDRGDKYNVQNCVPNGYTRKGDGSVQQITFSNDLKFKDSSKISVPGIDHPGWLVDLTRT